MRSFVPFSNKFCVRCFAVCCACACTDRLTKLRNRFNIFNSRFPLNTECTCCNADGRERLDRHRRWTRSHSTQQWHCTRVMHQHISTSAQRTTSQFKGVLLDSLQSSAFGLLFFFYFFDHHLSVCFFRFNNKDDSKSRICGTLQVTHSHKHHQMQTHDHRRETEQIHSNNKNSGFHDVFGCRCVLNCWMCCAHKTDEKDPDW